MRLIREPDTGRRIIATYAFDRQISIPSPCHIPDGERSHDNDVSKG
jgi:hypothetical protein